MQRSLARIILAALLFGLVALRPASGDFTFTLIHSGDTFAQVQPVTIGNNDARLCPPTTNLTECVGGVARRATLIQQLRAEKNNSLLVDSGSLFQGSLYWNEFGESVFRFYYDFMGYEAMNIDRRMFFGGASGLGNFLQNVTGLSAVSANMDVSAEPALTGRITTYKVVTVGTERIGITGFVNADLLTTVSSPGNVSLIDEVLGIRIAVSKMLEEGVNKIIVCLPEEPLVDPIINTVYGIDIAIVSNQFYSNNVNASGRLGGYPKVVPLPWGSPLLVVGQGQFGKYLGQLDVTFNDQGVITNYSGDTILLDSSIDYDPTIQADVIEKYNMVQEALGAIAGSSLVAMNYSNGPPITCRDAECLLGNFACDVLAESLGTDIAFINGGAVRDALPAGNITLGQLVNAYPFAPSSTTSRFRISGETLWDVLENSVSRVGGNSGTGRFLQVNSNLRYTFNRFQEPGYRVIIVEVRNPTTGVWAPLNNDTLYSVGTFDFIRSGGDGYSMIAPNAVEVVDFLTSLDEMLIFKLATDSPVTAALEGRISETNLTREDVNRPPTEEPIYTDWDDAAAIIFIILSVLVSFVVVAFAVFIAINFRQPPVRDTSIVLTMCHMVAMFVSCYIIFVFLGEPTDSLCAVQPWTSFMFTFVYGLLVAKQISLVVQWIRKKVKKDEGILHINHKLILCFSLFVPPLIVQTSYLIIWMAVDYPKVSVEETAVGDDNFYFACRSDPDIPWVVILFVLFGILMLIGLACSLILLPLLTMWREAKRVSVATIVTTLTICATIGAVNGTRDIPQAPFVLLAFGILVTIIAILAIVYAPLCYILIFKRAELKKSGAGINKVVTTNELGGNPKDDGLDDL